MVEVWLFLHPRKFLSRARGVTVQSLREHCVPRNRTSYYTLLFSLEDEGQGIYPSSSFPGKIEQLRLKDYVMYNLNRTGAPRLLNKTINNVYKHNNLYEEKSETHGGVALATGLSTHPPARVCVCVPVCVCASLCVCVCVQHEFA